MGVDTFDAPQDDAPSPMMRDIVRIALAFYGVTWAELISEKRDRKTVRRRQVSMWLVSQHVPRASSAMIGRHFDRDRTTAMHALDKIGGHVAADNEIGREAMRLSEITKRTINATKEN